MRWRLIFLCLALVFSICLIVVSVQPSFIPVTGLKEPVHIRLSESSYVPFYRDFDISGLSISGFWEGPGRAQVWLLRDKKQILVFDTRVLLSSLDFSGFGTRFDNICVDSCRFSPFKPKELFILVSGPGFLTIDEYNYAVPFSATGMASRNVQQVGPPDHRLILLIFLILIFVFGAHSVSKVCKRPKIKIAVAGLFILSFIVLSSIFGLSLFSPTSAFTLGARRVASIISAMGVITLFVIAGIEMYFSQKNIKSDKSGVWKELEEAEDEWCM